MLAEALLSYCWRIKLIKARPKLVTACGGGLSWLPAGGLKDHNFLTSRVNRNINFIFGILTSIAIDWYMNESIMRGSKGGGIQEGSGNFGEGLQKYTGPLSQKIKKIGILSSSPVDWHPCWVIWLRGRSGCLVIEMHGMSPCRPRGGVQANYQQLIPNLQFTHCNMQKLHDWCKKVLWQRFWLDLCTKQVVSARACANQVLPYSSSSNALFGMRTVQADSCLNSEQIDTLFISVGGQKGVFGGGGILGRRPKIYTWLSWK
jgi:hypothetical protein